MGHGPGVTNARASSSRTNTIATRIRSMESHVSQHAPRALRTRDQVVCGRERVLRARHGTFEKGNLVRGLVRKSASMDSVGQ